MPYPFTAIVGLPELRMALLLNAISPAIGGVLVRGEKGTAKSTMVRALAGLLPQIETVAGCRFGCDPAAPDADCPDGPHEPGAAVRVGRGALVELPVGATEDRLVGTLDLQRALTEGVKAYEPGLLAAAHRGMLYVDEVNLLPDHLVDLLLDAAAMGRAYVERDGVSIRHAARFLLVGTMNPEEGELRPQLLDRFGLTVQVAAPREAVPRAEVVRRRLAYDGDPVGFAARWAESEAELAAHIAAAAARLPDVILPDGELHRIASVCAAFDVDGMRADIVVARAATALAAWHGRPEVTEADVRDAVRLALPHRRRRDPFDAPGMDEEALDRALREGEPPPPTPDGGTESTDPNPERESADGPDDAGPDDAGPDGPDGPDGPGPDDPGPGGGPGSALPEGPDLGGGAFSPEPADRTDQPDRPDLPMPRVGPAGTRVAPAGPAFRAKLLAVPGTGSGARHGRRSPAFTRSGRVVAARRPDDRLTSLHLTATLRAAAPHQHARRAAAQRQSDATAPPAGTVPGPRSAGDAAGRSRSGTGPAILLHRDDLRAAVHKGREANLVLFVVDASGSMAARARMRTVKGAVLSLLRDAYQRRDKVGLVTFRGAGATLTLPPTTSHEIAAARLRELPTGGRTPLAAGLRTAAQVLATEHRRDPFRRPLLVLVTDGRTTAGPDPAAAAGLLRDVACVVVDCESGPVRLGLAGRLAVLLDAEHLRLEELSADGLRAVAIGRAA